MRANPLTPHPPPPGLASASSTLYYLEMMNKFLGICEAIFELFFLSLRPPTLQGLNIIR